MITAAATESLTAFSAEALGFLEGAAPLRPAEVHIWGQGDEGLTIFHETGGDDELAEVDAAKVWQARKWAAGFGWITGPVDHAGRGLPVDYDRCFRSLESTFAVADLSPLRIGLSTVGPGILASGTPEQVERFSVPIQQGRTVACQLFSEPEAGSDLAGVRTRATRDGGVWLLDGQKVWTSNAQFADIGLALVRTDVDAPKHRGLTVMVVPMDQPAVEVRPLRQLTGGASFAEVFLDGAVVPDDHVVGAVGEGWRVAMSALTAERTSTGDRSHGLTGRAFALLLALARRTGGAEDPVHRQRLADVALRLRIAGYHQQRMQAVPIDQLVGPERAMDKMVLADNLRRLGEAAAALLGPALIADTGQWGTAAWARWILGATGYRIGGGTDEVLRTMLGERLLGLPREPSGG